MNILLIWIKNPLPTEYKYTLKTLLHFLKSDDTVNIVVDEFTKDIEEFKSFNKILFSDLFSDEEIKKINAINYIENISDLIKFKWLSSNEGLYMDIDCIHFKDFHTLIDNNYNVITFLEKLCRLKKDSWRMAGIIYSKDTNLFKLIFNKAMCYSDNESFLKFVKVFNDEIKNYEANNSKLIKTYNHNYYNILPFVKQIIFWKSDVNIIVMAFKMLSNNQNSFGLFLMKDVKQGKFNREEAVIKYISGLQLNV